MRNYITTLLMLVASSTTLTAQLSEADLIAKTNFFLDITANNIKISESVARRLCAEDVSCAIRFTNNEECPTTPHYCKPEATALYIQKKQRPSLLNLGFNKIGQTVYVASQIVETYYRKIIDVSAMRRTALLGTISLQFNAAGLIDSIQISLSEQPFN